MANNEYPRTPFLVKGAFIEFSERFIGPVPNIIIFQYNPTTLSRALSPWEPCSDKKDGGTKTAADKGCGTTQPFDPEETFNVNLLLDATDDLESSDPMALLGGVSDRLSAIEMLLYPQENSLVGDLLSAAGDALSGAAATLSVDQAKRGSIPITLFVWGPGRIVPVRLTSFTVEEEAFSPVLYPIRAKVNVGLRILHPSELENHPNAVARELAKVCYGFTKTQKEVWAAANLANAVQSALSLIP